MRASFDSLSHQLCCLYFGGSAHPARSIQAFTHLYPLHYALSCPPGRCVLHVTDNLHTYIVSLVGVDINADMRAAALHLYNSLGVAELVTTIYPRLYALHKMSEDVKYYHSCHVLLD